MAVRPFRLCTAADRAAIAAQASQAWSAWAADWLGAGRNAAISCAPIAALDGGDAAVWYQARGAAATVWVAAEQLRAVTSWLFGTPQESAGSPQVFRSPAGGGLGQAQSGGQAQVAAASLTTTVAQAGMNALLQQLAAAAPQAQASSPSPSPSQAPSAEGGVQRTPAPRYLLDAGRSAWRGVIGLDAAEFVFFAELPATEPALSPLPEPLSAIGAVLGTQPVQLDVWLGDAELALHALQTLAVGDVLRLDRRLDEPVELRAQQQRLSCVGYLGVRDGRLAVEIARR